MEIWGRLDLKAHTPGILPLVLAFCIGPSVALAHQPAAGAKILVEPFDLFDTSIDHRAFVLADQKRWLVDAVTAMRSELADNKKLTVVNGAATERATASALNSYQHPSACRSCAIDAARSAGAQYVFIGSIHKVSDLIIYMRGELDSVGHSQPLMVKSMEVKADNKTMILRAAATMVSAINRNLLLKNERP